MLLGIFVCLGWILLVFFHEYGHAVIAYRGVDTSTENKGYLTFNPLNYINFNQSLFLPLLFLLIGGIALPGAAVYIDQRRLYNRRLQSAISANGLITSTIAAELLAIVFQWSLPLRHSQYSWVCPALALLIFLQIYVTIVNSLPIPGLDGYSMLEPWLPGKLQDDLAKYKKLGILILFVLIWFVKPVSLFLDNFSVAICQILNVPLIDIKTGFALLRGSSNILLVIVISLAFILRILAPYFPKILLNIGNKLNNFKQYEQAIIAYNTIIQLQPTSEQTWCNRGLALFKLNQFQEALDSFNRAIKLQPNSYKNWTYQALTLNYLKEYEAAITSYDKAIAIEPKYEFVWHYRGITLDHLQRYKEAIASYNQALTIKPDFTQTWTHLGCVLIKVRCYEEAIICFEQVIELKPNEAKAWIDRAEALIKLQRYEEALTDCAQALKLKSKLYHNLAWLNKGKALEKMSQTKEALASYQKILEIEPGNSAFNWYIQGYALLKLRRYQQGITACNKAIQIEPRPAYALYTRACCYAKQNKVKLAVRDLNQAIKFAPYIREEAKTESSFDPIRNNDDFKNLLNL